MLTGMYVTLGLFGWPMVVMSVIGVLETMIGLRARVRRGPPPPPVFLNRN